MDITSTDRDALRAAGLSDALAGVLADTLEEHDAAGRPLIVLPPPEESLRQHRIRAALAPLFIAAETVLDRVPDQAAALAAAVERDGVEGARTFLARLGPELAAELSTALGIDVSGRLRAALELAPAEARSDG